MPARYMTYPGGGPVLPVKRIGRAPRPDTIHLNESYLSGFGDLLADSDEARHAFQFEAGHPFRFEAGHGSDLKPTMVPCGSRG
jgi:hypothetical protein